MNNKEPVKLNYVLDKLSSSGIEVITDKDEFDRILESQKVLQKMSADLSKIEKLSKQLNEEKSKTEKLEKTVEQQKSDIQHQNYEEFIKYLDSVKDYIPEEINFSEKMNIMGVSYYHKLTNKIPINFDSSDAYEWIVKPDNNDKKLYIVSSHYTGLRDIYNYEEVKQYFSDNSILTTFQDSLTSFLTKNISLEKEKQKNFINDLDKQTEELKILEKREAYKNVSSWLYEAEENAEHLWNKEKEDVKEYFKNNDERKFIGIIPTECMQLFDGIEDYHLYADKSYLIHHYINRHPDVRLYDNIQNVLDNYTNIYFDNEQNSIGFVKVYGKLADCLFVKNDNGKIVLFGSTYNQPELRLHSSRYKKITPVKKQEQNMSLEGSTPLSQNPEGNTAAAISDVNDNLNIPQSITMSSPLPKIQKMTVSEYNNKEVYAFVTDKSDFVDPEKVAAIDLYGFEKAKKLWEGNGPDWNTRMMLQNKSISDYLNWKHPNNQNYKADNITYGFTYNNKIYLNPDIMNSEIAVHEYTHLWDNYTQKTNPELWEKGKSIFKDTYYWNEVKSDPNYADITDNDDLILSEVHSRICGKFADKVLERIVETDGKITKDKAIDWDKETWEYIYKSLHISVNHKMDKGGNSFVDLKDFLAMPMKDLMNEKHIVNSDTKNNTITEYVQQINFLKKSHECFSNSIENNTKYKTISKEKKLSDKLNNEQKTNIINKIQNDLSKINNKNKIENIEITKKGKKI